MVTTLDELPAVRREYPWHGRYVETRHGRLHVIDEGPRDAPVIVAVHGNPTWSFYWRTLIRRFGATHRVIVPDHMGCGLSDKPQDWSYRLADHVDNLQTVLDALRVKQFTLVVHDWGGAIGSGVAVRDPSRVQRLVITNTAAFRSLRIPPSIALCKIPVFGQVGVRGFNGFAEAATRWAVERPLTPEARAGLLFPYGNWHDRIATLRFVQDIPLHPAHPSYAALSEIDEGLTRLAGVPMLIVWGEKDFCFTPKFREEWQRRFPAAEVLALPEVGHYVMEDAPERALEAMTAFFARHRVTGER